MSDRAETLVRVGVTLACAASLSLISTPVEWWWFHPLVYLPMFWVVREGRTRANLLYGWLYGAVGVALLFRWLAYTIDAFSDDFSRAPAIGIVLLFGAVFGAPWALVWAALPPLRRRVGSGWVLAWPAMIVLIDWISSFVLLFPFQHGVTLYRVPPLWQLLSVTGIWGPTFLVFFWNAALAEGFLRWRAGRPMPWVAPASAVAVTAGIAVWGAARFARIEELLRAAPQLRVAQLQSSHGMEWVMSRPARTRARDVWDEWSGLVARVTPGSADLVVLPESSCQSELNKDPRTAQTLGALARAGRFDLVVGAGAREGALDPATGERRERNFNSVYFISSEGDIQARYDKMVPLPFGEYVPFADLLPIPHIDGIGDFKAGEIATVWDSGQARLATPICYEAILGRVCRQFNDPDLLLNGTNDGWFGDTAALHQHAMLAAERATELGVPLYRAAYNGISLAVEPHGHIHSETAPFEEVSRIVTIRLGKVETVYARLGDWFVALCGVGLASALLAARRRNARAAAASSPSAPDAPPV